MEPSSDGEADVRVLAVDVGDVAGVIAGDESHEDFVDDEAADDLEPHRFLISFPFRIFLRKTFEFFFFFPLDARKEGNF